MIERTHALHDIVLHFMEVDRRELRFLVVVKDKEHTSTSHQNKSFEC